MPALYVASTATFSGKSALCVGLAKKMLQDGLTVGYMKPVSSGDRLSRDLVDEDAVFFRETFSLPDALEDMVPIGIGSQTVEGILEGNDVSGYAARLVTAYECLASRRDLMLLEGGCNLREGLLVDLPATRVADLLDAREVVVIKYDDDMQMLDDALAARDQMTDSFLGVVLNAVPRQRMPFVQEVARPALEMRGVRVLAVLPRERLLLSISVEELAGFLSGEILCGQDKVHELVEHLMVGAMSVDSALAYFRRKPNKAVITGGDRPDIQLAALETSTKCLILTGNLRPNPIIVRRAEEVGVPMVLVRQDTLAAVEVIERFFGKTRFHQEQKVHRFEELLADRFDFDTVYRAMGVA